MKAVKQIASLLLLVCFCCFSFGNNQENLDSLIIQFKLSDTDSAKYSTLKDINTTLFKQNKDKVLGTWNSLIKYCEKNNDYWSTGYCYYYLAVILNSDGEYFKSYNAYNRSKNIFETIDNKRGLARVHNGLGILHKNLNKFKQSLNHYTISAKISKELKDSIRESWVYLNLGGMLETQDSLDLAKIYLKKSEKILVELNDSNLINCYINLGEVLNKEKKYDSAFYYYNKSYKISKNYGDPSDKFHARSHLGNFLFEQNRILEAEPLILEAKKIADNQNNINFISIDNRAEFAKLLSNLYARKGDNETALLMLNQYVNYETETKREQSNNELNRFEFERSIMESSVEQKRRTFILYSELVLLLISLLFIATFYRSYKHKQKANLLLTEMDELKTRLYSNITHELRTPLTLILGPLEQILSSETRKKFTHKQVKMMLKNAKSLLNMINQMLDLSKIEAKGVTLELVERDINKYIRTRFAAFASLAQHKSISYKYSLLKEKNIRIFDATKIEKIINNLISNAIKFTPQNGEISCYTNFSEHNILELIVHDSGKGIPKNELDIIFDRFHQVENSEMSNTIGTGIGLSLTKELIELMHGKIKVESELGKGTKFIVRLPLGTEHLNKKEYHLIQNYNPDIPETFEVEESVEETADRPNYQDSKNGSTNLPHVLVTEDQSDIREFIAENLKKCFNVEQAENGKIGLKKAIENIPDLVITDIVMPEMDGIEFCRNLKTDEKTSHIPVIMLTGKSSIDDRIKGLETGADAYLNKPFNIKELKLRVRKLIEQRQKLRERFANNLTLEPKDIAITSADENFISRVMEIIEKNIGNSEFEVRQFQDEMLMSRMQLFRKIKALTNQTPGEFVRTIRLKRAASLMQQNFGNIAQITFEVGFNNPSYFAKCFKELFGKLPSKYIKNHD